MKSINKIKTALKRLFVKEKVENSKTMVRGDWGHEKRVWGIENDYNPGRAIQIYEEIKDLEFKNLVDIACGFGMVAESLKWVFPDKDITQFDFWDYPEWEKLSVVPYRQDVMDFIKEDKKYDIVMFLNSYRNWDKKDKFNEWLYGHAKYFITSGENNIRGKKKIIGMDSKGHKMEIYKIR